MKKVLDVQPVSTVSREPATDVIHDRKNAAMNVELTWLEKYVTERPPIWKKAPVWGEA
jgi:hypothetical protein